VWKGKLRRSRYSNAAAERVLESIRNGDTLREIAARPGMPRMGTLDRWLRESDEFRALYESARRFRCEVLGDDVAAAADKAGAKEIPAKRFRFQVLKWDIDLRSRAIVERGSPRRGR
jgi:hypothetical protein